MADVTGFGNADSKAVGSARALMLAAVAVWFAVAFVVGLLGGVNQPGRAPTVVLGFIVVPMLTAILAYLTSASFRAAAESLPLTLLVGSHLWRFVGVFFVAGWVEGVLPAGFGIPEGFGDIIAALGALLLLPMIRKGTAPRGWLLAWNVWGLVDLASAITMGVLYSESTLGVLSPGTPTTRLMTTFPASLIPTFFVPLFILFHLLTFKKLAAGAARVGGTSEVPFGRRQAQRA
jgi:hypothetical protein